MATHGLPTLADLATKAQATAYGHRSSSPSNGCPLDADNRTYNALLRSLCCLGERSFALLTTRWRVLHHVTACPQKIGDITKAALVLTHFEHRYLTC